MAQVNPRHAMRNNTHPRARAHVYAHLFGLCSFPPELSCAQLIASAAPLRMPYLAGVAVLLLTNRVLIVRQAAQARKQSFASANPLALGVGGVGPRSAGLQIPLGWLTGKLTGVGAG